MIEKNKLASFSTVKITNHEKLLF